MGLPLKRAVVGIVLALGAPVGWLLIRWIGSGSTPMTELTHDPMLYLYMLLSTSLTFAVFGLVVGSFEDRVLRANEELERQSRTDALTGLDNVRNFSETLPRLISYAHRSGAPLAVVMMDVDRFKQINDRYGHLVGDIVLKELGRVLGEGRRKEDVLARIGGEEFVVALPGIDRAGAERVAARILDAVRSIEVKVENARVRVTISAGIAELQPGDEPRALLSRADEALYKAKRDGRNRFAASSIAMPRALP